MLTADDFKVSKYPRPGRFKFTCMLGLILAMGILAVPGLAGAQGLIVDRGLPMANLNAAVDRSNILWADRVAQPGVPDRAGDDFVLPGTEDYIVTKIRVWSQHSSGLTLWGGKAGQAKTQISSNPTVTPVTYANGDSYVGSAGTLQLYQIDFTVNLPLTGGTTYQFFLGGPTTVSGSDNVGVHLHSSNAALSGSTQDGADNTLLFLTNSGTVLTWNSAGGGTYNSGQAGAAVDTDGNVQVFGALAPPPIPTMTEWALILFATLLVGGTAVYIQRRRLTV